MKQLEVNASQVVPMNYEADNIPEAVKEFRPVLFQQGDAFCCLLGPNAQIGVFGCGLTKEEAIKDWQADFDRHLQNRENTYNEVTQFILDTLATSKRNVW